MVGKFDHIDVIGLDWEIFFFGCHYPRRVFVDNLGEDELLAIK